MLGAPTNFASDRKSPTGAVVQAGFNTPSKSNVIQAQLGGPVHASFNQEPAPAEVSGPPAAKMTFDEAVQATLMADPKIRAGFEAIVQARADLVTSSLFPNPTVLVDALALPTRPVTPDRTSGPPQMDVFTGYPIDWFLFGKRAAAMASARVGVKQSEADYADLIRQRVLACASAFYDLVEARELLKLAKDDLTHLAKLESITEKAVDAGNRKKVDLDRVRLDKLKSEQAVREAESIVVVAKARLRQLLGKTEADPQFEISADIDAPLTAERIELEKAYALAQENRPDIQSLRWQVDKARADVVVEDRKKYPDVTPAFGYTRQYQGSAIGQPDAQTWNVSITTTLPILNRNQGNRMKARSVLVQNGYLLETGLVDLRADVTQAFQDFQTAQKNAEAIGQEQKKTAKSVLDAILTSYEKVGAPPYVDVLDAERNYRDTVRAYISSRANYWRSVYRFSAAIGKQITPGQLP
jgi:cobalt-zinc-cadmium efflux system outer membrane protein